MHRGMRRCAEICRGVHRGARRYAEVCGGMQRCTEVHGGMWNSSILAARRFFKKVVGKKSGCYVN